MLEDADPAIRHIIERKIRTSREAMARLDKMDLELLDVMMASGDDLTGIKLNEARKKYGKAIEERYGYTFPQTQRAAKLW
ncbi:hypothetical protein HP388_10875 [Escherichia coli]|uniref:Uncharacterized protein n=4 Tax=Escherichia coli TaxID=562 RepID=A0A6N8QV26_ECOLX|nr:hypothetical protein [Escherichia coli]EGO3713954.1 hypothetical protein [Escherichia coli]MBW9408484.1 hypothetical protein [Escherichia coli]MBW9514992.1 hypothetical protein [Escherichia coli]MBW9523008.1 hypothetical protein [Escherichia coli]